MSELPEDLQITVADLNDAAKLPELPMKVNRYIKHILAKWEADPAHDAQLLLETKKSLFPMLVKLRKNTLEKDALTSLLTIFYHLQKAQFMKANESYMKLSIGNVAWPIGVSGVSIHSRKAQSRLDDGNKAMIMLDEPTRKWITAVKRLITYTERTHKPTSV